METTKDLTATETTLECRSENEEYQARFLLANQ